MIPAAVITICPMNQSTKKKKEPLIGPSSTGVSGAFFKIRHISLRSSRTEPIFFLIAFLETAHERQQIR